MQLDLVIDRKTNFYYWVQALSGWSIYYGERKQYEYFIHILPHLSLEHERVLDDISSMLKSLEHPRRVLAELYSGRLSDVSRPLSEIADQLDGLFEPVWHNQSMFLYEWQQKLIGLDTSRLADSMVGIARFFDSDFNIKMPVKTYLLMNPAFGAAIGHSIRDTDFILIHPAGGEIKQPAATTFSTIIHEYIHSIEFKSNITEDVFRNSYETYIKPRAVNAPDGYSWSSLYKEIIVQCFANNVTGGYFRPETYGKPLPTVAGMQKGFYKLLSSGECSVNQLISWVALNLLPDVQDYLDKNIVMDDILVSRMSKLILEFIVDKKSMTV